MNRRAFSPIFLIPPVAALAVYAVTLGGDFVFDDIVLVGQDSLLKEFDWRRVLWDNYWGTERFDLNYRPFVLLTYALNHQLSSEPFGFHLVNVLLNAAAAWIACLVFRELLRDDALAALGATVYALLPIHTEAVAGVVGRAEILAGLAVLASWLVALRDPSGRRPGSILLVGLSVFLGLCSKENTIVLVPLLIVAPWILRRRLPWKSILVAAAAVGLYLALRHAALADDFRTLARGGATLATEVDNPLDSPFSSAPTRVLNATRLLGLYAWKTAVPIHLSADYSYNQIPVLPLASARLWLEALGLAGLTALGVWFFWRRNPVAALGLLFFPIAFLVTSNLLFAIGTIFGERLAYLPSLAYPIFLCAVLEAGVNRRALPRRLVLGGLALLAALYGGRTAARCLDWRDKETLNTVTYLSSPHSTRAQMLGSAVALERGMRETDRQLWRKHFDEALERARRALDIYPQSGRALGRIARVHLERGEKESSLTDFQEAEENYTRALTVLHANTQSEPDFWFRRGLARLGQARLRLAELGQLKKTADVQERARVAAEAIGKLQQSVEDFEDYVSTLERRSIPKNPHALHFRGLARAILADFVPDDRRGPLRQLALDDFNEAIRLRQDLPEFYANRGFLRFKMQNSDGALIDYRKGLEICEKKGLRYDPQKDDVSDFLQRIASVHTSRGDREAAEEALKRAEEILDEVREGKRSEAK